MKFRAFNKNLSGELENLFATIGNAEVSAEAVRLDQSVNFDDIMERIKNVDSTSSIVDKKDQNA